MIQTVYRVRCDGPGCGVWLTDRAARTIAGFPGERSARRAAERSGWARGRPVSPSTYEWLCPACKENPLGIKLPSWQVTNGSGE